MGEIPCKVVDCPTNRRGHCMMPSVIKLGPDGVCEQYKKLRK